MSARAKHRAVCAVVLSTVLSGCSGVQSTLDPGGHEARRIADLFWWMTAGSVVVWIAVLAIAWWAIRADPARGDRRRQARLLILGGALSPAIVLGILLVYALSVFNYPVFALVGFDGQIALVLAFATQFGAIVAIGNWLRLRQDQDRRWIVFMAVALVCTLSMTVITAARAQMFLEAIDVPGILRPAFAIVFAMAVPLASWVTGSITSSAADALSSPSQILRWAAEHREAIVGAVAGHEAEL